MPCLECQTFDAEMAARKAVPDSDKSSAKSNRRDLEEAKRKLAELQDDHQMKLNDALQHIARLEEKEDARDTHSNNSQNLDGCSPAVVNANLLNLTPDDQFVTPESRQRPAPASPVDVAGDAQQ